jgi:hypothetical protein
MAGSRAAFSGKMPSDDVNGLNAITKDLLDNPRQLRLVVAIVDVEATNVNHDKGIEKPRLRVRHIEPILSDKDVAEAQNLLSKALAARTGAEQLPFEHGFEVPVDDFEGDDDFADSQAPRALKSVEGG